MATVVNDILTVSIGGAGLVIATIIIQPTPLQITIQVVAETGGGGVNNQSDLVIYVT